MQIAQLYIDGQRVDMFDDVSISITDTIKDVRDISKVFTEYSQTFSLPASKTNNKIFKHFYNNDIQNGFDARIRVPANIELSSIPFRNGFIKLEGVDLKNNTAHTYRITFFGNTISLKNLLGDDLLSSLSWLDNFSTEEDGTDLLYDKDFIEKYLTTSEYSKFVDGVRYPNAIQIPLITHTQRLYYDSSEDIRDTGNVHYNHASGTNKQHGVKFNELKYALRLSVIIKAIEEKYGLNFSDDFFKGGDSSFDNLYMWLHRKKGNVENLSGVNEALIDGFADGSDVLTASIMSNNALSLYFYTPPTSVLQYTQINLKSTTSSTNPYRISIRKNGIEVVNSGTITSGVEFITSVPSNEIEQGSQYTAYIESDYDITFSNITFQVYKYDNTNIPAPPIIFSKGYAITNYQYTNSFKFIISQQIPKMKVLDFLTSLFNMFNLVAYVEGSQMVVKSLDDFYANPSLDSPYDITKYVDVNSSKIDSALPFREVNYSYKGLKTFLSKRHEQLFSEDWGTEEYKGGESTILSEGIFNVEVPFEHMKFERLLDVDAPNPPTDIQCGYCVDDNQQSYIGQPLIFYMDRKTLDTGGKISFVDVVGTVNGEDNVATSHKEISSYFTPANSDLDVTLPQDRQSLHFSSENDEWELSTTTETLFNNYHINYISSIFNASNRLTKITAYLPLRILYKYTLADRFIVSGKSYKINSIETDFYTGKSEIELLSDI